jgi:hypothetical protein
MPGETGDAGPESPLQESAAPGALPADLFLAPDEPAAPALPPQPEPPQALLDEAVADLDVEFPDFAGFVPNRDKPAAPRARLAEPKPRTIQEEATSGEVVGREAARDEAGSREAGSGEEGSRGAGRERSPARRGSARRVRNVRPEQIEAGRSAADLWARAPAHLRALLALESEGETAQSSYKRAFGENRRELIERLLDPVLSLEETARLLNVCPTTIRRYTNRGLLHSYRKEPAAGSAKGQERQKETRQRRFRLSDVLLFLEAQGGALADADPREPEPGEVDA